jgi:inner membrane protein
VKTDNRLRQQLHEKLHEQLLALPYAAFEQVMRELLSRSGYSCVQMVGRKHKRGRTRAGANTQGNNTQVGGHDLKAYTQTDITSALTLTQIKQYQRVVSRRFIDELRGTMLRTGATQGLLITTSTFSRVAYKAAMLSDIAPVRLVDGVELLHLMMDYHLGVKPNEQGRLCLDAAYFDNLQERSRCTGEKPQAHGKPSTHKRVPNKGSGAKGEATAEETTVKQANGSGGKMLWRTHVLAGISCLWLLEAVPPGIQRDNLALLAGVAAFGALLPDLDAAESKIKHLSVARIKPFYIPAQAIHRQLGHRGFSHSLAGVALLALVASSATLAIEYIDLPLLSFWNWQASAALVLGYASHLAADASTKSGIPLLYVPLVYPKKRRYHLLPPSLRFTTGSQAEETLFPLLALLILLLLLNHLSPQNGELMNIDFE